MLLKGCSSISGSVCLKNKAWTANSYVPLSRSSAHFPSSGIRNSLQSSRKENPWSSRGNLSLKLSASLTPLLRSIPSVPSRCKPLLPPKAAKDIPPDFHPPTMTDKPKWLWRIVAFLSYLAPVHRTFLYTQLAYHFHPSLGIFKFLNSYTIPHMSLLEKFPIWFHFVHWLFFIFVTMVWEKNCPNFLRSHVVIAGFLAIAIDAINYLSFKSPLAMYWGKLGMYFWASITFVCLVMALECIRCALAGKYSDVPFVCDTVHKILSLN